ncbi:MAG: hypothetical protein ACYTG1_08010 [Planctomycetota bacterium]
MSSHRPRPHVTRIAPGILGAVLGLAALGGCQATPPHNAGASGGRLDPTHDSRTEAGTLALRSQDLVNATDRMARDIAGRLDVNDPAAPTRIVVGEIENRTSYPYDDYQVFLARLRAVLQQSGARHGLEFIRERPFVQRERDREFGGQDPARAAGAYVSDVEYVLTCEVFDLPSGATNYFLLDYQLVQLVDAAASGPNRGSGRIVWENMYEVKFQ